MCLSRRSVLRSTMGGRSDRRFVRTATATSRASAAFPPPSCRAAASNWGCTTPPTSTTSMPCGTSQGRAPAGTAALMRSATPAARPGARGGSPRGAALRVGRHRLPSTRQARVRRSWKQARSMSCPSMSLRFCSPTGSTSQIRKAHPTRVRLGTRSSSSSAPLGCCSPTAGGARRPLPIAGADRHPHHRASRSAIRASADAWRPSTTGFARSGARCTGGRLSRSALLYSSQQ
mmetsp:Transcript_11615/g.36033  ORF Transcript_11615/g.36033 Transcript_11615/m.36033 type:complete len:232 (+) Transcript_11615:211-906(+)